MITVTIYWPDNTETEETFPGWVSFMAWVESDEYPEDVDLKVHIESVPK